MIFKLRLNRKLLMQTSYDLLILHQRSSKCSTSAQMNMVTLQHLIRSTASIILITYYVNIFTARIRRMTGGYVFTGVCPSTLVGGTPFPGLDGGRYPILRYGWRYPLPRSGWAPILVRSEVRTGGCPGVPPPAQDWMGYSPTIPWEQHSEHLLRGGWYASCIHTGGLSCSLKE